MGVNLESIAASWGGRGFSCDFRSYPPGHVEPAACGSEDELIAVVDGELDVVVGGAARHLQSGDQMYIPAQTPHSIRNAGGRSVRWLQGHRMM